jgi:hypothetical protein
MNGIRELAMPRIGCGMDGLNWQAVKDLLFEIFGEIYDLLINVYHL